MSGDETTTTKEASAPPPAPAAPSTPPANGTAEPAKADAGDAAPMSNPYAKEGAASAEVFVAEGAKKRKKKPVEIAIRLTKVTKRFGVKTAVDGVSLKVKAGSVYGLIGPNGAGKTTTFSMMAGFLQPTEGVLEVLGYSPMQVDELRSRIGVLPQDALLPGADKVGEFLVHMAQLQDIPSRPRARRPLARCSPRSTGATGGT